MAKLHPIIRAAAREGAWPEWAEMSPGRQAHSERVGKLLGKWARELDLSKRERRRWRAGGLLHDALKDARPAKLRKRMIDPEGWPDPLLHGPACAERLRADGVEDEGFLLAVSHHTTGHADFDALGEALYMADYLDPGRRGLKLRRSDWRRRMPGEWHDVLIEVAASKIGTLLARQVPIPAVTKDFWNKHTS